MEDVKGRLDPIEQGNGQTGGVQTGQAEPRGSQALDADAVRIRAERANLLEKTTYQITDLLTIILGRIEILSDKVPDLCKEELQSIRSVVAKGVELNKRFFLAVQACRREIGV